MLFNLLMFVMLTFAFNVSSLQSHIKISSESLWFLPSLDSNVNTRMSSCPIIMYPYQNKSLTAIDGEKWKEINGTDGFYSVSNFGRVKRSKLSPNRSKPIKILSPSHPERYLTVHLRQGDKHWYWLVHRLVAIHFIDNPNEDSYVNHKDGNKLNNHFSNLEWCTAGENIRHSFKMGLQVAKRGEEIGNSKLKNEDIVFMRKNRDEYTVEEFSEMFEVKHAAICQIIANYTWRHIKVHHKKY